MHLKANNVDPDQMAADVDLHYSPMGLEIYPMEQLVNMNFLYLTPV
jgi:hypothetical protein